MGLPDMIVVLKSEEGVHGNAKTMLSQFSVCVLLDLLILLSQSLEPQR